MTTLRNRWRIAEGVVVFLAVITGSSLGAPKYLPKNAIELFEIPAVAKDLGLTEDQLKQFKSLVAARRAEIADFGSVLRRDELRNRSNDSPQIIENHKAALAELDSQALAVLLPAQRKRLEQILRQFAVRREGITFGLTSKAISDELKLSDAQQQTIRDKADEVQTTIEEKLAKLRKEMEGVILEGRADLLEVLTKEQKTKYLELMGRDFDLSDE